MTILFPRKMCAWSWWPFHPSLSSTSLRRWSTLHATVDLPNQHKKILHFLYTFTHAGLARKRKRKKNSLSWSICENTSTLRFQRWREKEKCLLYHPVEEKNTISWRQDHSLEHPVLKTSWLASKVRSSARRRRWEREQREEQYRTFLTSLRCQDLPSCSCDSRSIQHSFNIFCLRQNWTWRTRYEEIVPYLSFPQSSASSASQENRICQKINARKNILDIAWYTSCWKFWCNTRSSGFSTSQDKDTAAPFDHADRRYVVDGIRVVLSLCLHQQEDHFEQLATCV